MPSSLVRLVAALPRPLLEEMPVTRPISVGVVLVASSMNPDEPAVSIFKQAEPEAASEGNCFPDRNFAGATLETDGKDGT
jgi:hypothetical protein